MYSPVKLSMFPRLNMEFLYWEKDSSLIKIA